MDWNFLRHPFTLGLLLGLVFAMLAAWQLFRLKMEMKRYRRHLSDKLEIEADSLNRIRREQELLRKENENLRMKVGAFNQSPEGHLRRDLETFARAEKRMLVSVPGFAPAWENAKTEAGRELDEEEAGRSSSKTVFTRLFGGGKEVQKALPDQREPDR